MVIERALAFGGGGGLVGVLAEPSAGRAPGGSPAFLMWNVGIQHRIGPYRIQVDLARALARRGFASLRFDLSGMGDSKVRADAQIDVHRALGDVREAMSLLEKRLGVRTFIPIGFCSSVDSAHALALDDARVVGACFLEGYAYRTRGYWLRYPSRLLDHHRWKRFLAYHLGERLGFQTVNPVKRERSMMGSVFARQYPTRERFAADVQRLASGGTRMLFVYVGGDSEFNHPGQFAEMTGGRTVRGDVEVEYYEDADHTFFRVTDRARVVARVARWATTKFGGAGGDAR